MTLRYMHWLVDGYGQTSASRNREQPRGLDCLPGEPRRRRVRHPRRQVPPLAQEPPADAGKDRRGHGPEPELRLPLGKRGPTSKNPRAITYRGPSAFSAPETRAIPRDFLASRVVDGRQQNRTAITFHEYGRLVMWPYGYTYTDVPADITTDYRSALMIILWHTLAATNGYKPETGQRPLSHVRGRPATTCTAPTARSRTRSSCQPRITSDDSLIAAETGRNKEAVLYLISGRGAR